MGSWCPSKHSWQNLYKNTLRSHDLKARFKPRLHIWSLSSLGRGALDRNTSFNLMTSFTCAMITPLSLRVSYSIGKFSQVTISGLLCTTYNNQNSFTFTQKLCITFHAKKWGLLETATLRDFSSQAFFFKHKSRMAGDCWVIPPPQCRR